MWQTGPRPYLHGQLAGLPDVLRERLKSKRPFVPSARKPLNDLSKLDIHTAHWTNYIRRAEYSKHTSALHVFIPRASLGPLERARPKHLGLNSIACELAYGVFTRLCTNGVSLLHRIASVAPPIKPQITLPQRAPYIGHLEGWLV